MLLRRLAVFAGGFDLEAAEEVCAGDALDAAAIADVLGRLVEKSLVAVERGLAASAATGCSRPCACTRASGSRRPARRASVRATAMRDWALALAEAQRGRAAARPRRRQPPRRTGTLLEDAPADALRLCVALAPFWLRRIDLDEG